MRMRQFLVTCLVGAVGVAAPPNAAVALPAKSGTVVVGMPAAPSYSTATLAPSLRQLRSEIDSICYSSGVKVGSVNKPYARAESGLLQVEEGSRHPSIKLPNHKPEAGYFPRFWALPHQEEEARREGSRARQVEQLPEGRDVSQTRTPVKERGHDLKGARSTCR